MSHRGAGFPFPIALCQVTTCVRSPLRVAFPLHSLVAMTGRPSSGSRGGHQRAEFDACCNAWVHDVGKLWMPGAAGIGPYSGKETLALMAWLGTWQILHYALRNKDLEISRWFIVFLVGVGIATTLIWPPVFEYLAGN